MVNRVGYIYLRIAGGAGVIKYGGKKQNDITMKEFVYFWLFDYLLLYKNNNKKSIIDILHKYNDEKQETCSLKYLCSNFKPYIHLLDLLINDTYVEEGDKEFVRSLKFNYTENINKNAC